MCLCRRCSSICLSRSLRIHEYSKSAASAASLRGGRASGRLDHGFFCANFGRATGFCKKKYPFKNWVSECANPPPVSSKLKVYSRVTCRLSEIKYPFCKRVCGQNTFSTLTNWGEGWVRQKHEYRKGTCFCKYRGQILS